jgi:uncharacterized protein
MDLLYLFDKYFPTREVREIVLTHSRLVTEKALAVATALDDPGLDLAFIGEAALLHDIGICRVRTARFGGEGSEPYIRHGIIGREILEAEGLPRHALVCERHIGVGLTPDDIVSQNLPLPLRDMSPRSTEERIVCFADLFYSKTPGGLTREKSPDEVRRSLERFGGDKAATFDGWLAEFLASG